jgi:hypothetical protein
MFLDIACFLSKEYSPKFGGVWTRQKEDHCSKNITDMECPITTFTND